MGSGVEVTLSHDFWSLSGFSVRHTSLSVKEKCGKSASFRGSVDQILIDRRPANRTFESVPHYQVPAEDADVWRTKWADFCISHLHEFYHHIRPRRRLCNPVIRAGE
ncbi:uncharacterized protein LOC122503393 isoform X1 [Leptopilina heterotoma]|uniref:uncharacterized protein LOC122503393 isoform X1 n=1 Tax=Leptopilina heterotoma TaxID=63436 RepID=UPI001CAA0E11|nr:uncharacterized protein LOC122503393 isoform X1 [Leptopilina heterotoma]